MFTLTKETIDIYPSQVQSFLNLNFPNEKLVVDGQFGIKSALLLDKYLAKVTKIMLNINKDELENRTAIAKLHTGIQEIPGNMGFKKSIMQDLMVQMGWRKSEAWCSYFAELVWSLTTAATEKNVAINHIEDVDLLYAMLATNGKIKNVPIFSGSTQRTLSNFVNSDKHVLLPLSINIGHVVYIAPNGSLPVWVSQKNKSLGHIGVKVKSVPAEESMPSHFQAVEGNTSDAGVREGGRVGLLTTKNDLRGSLWLQGFLC